MLIRYGKKHTPSTRFKKYLKYVVKTSNFLFKDKIKLLNFKNSKKYRKFSLNRRVFFKRKKFFCKNLATRVYWLSFVKNFLVDLRKKYTVISDKFNNLCVIPFITNHYPGLVIRTLKSNHYRILGQQIFLWKVPINSIISKIFDKFNIKSTYCNSVGSLSYKRKQEKKNKLIQVELPSKTIKLFKKLTIVTYGFFKFFKNKTLCEGKWGFTDKIFKKVNVRGVAKNPVDHPNGGRTKAKQPEKSPWGWVAKHNK